MKKDFSDQRRLLVVWALCVAALIVYGIALSGCTVIKKAIDEKRTDKAKSQFDRHPDSAAHYCAVHFPLSDSALPEVYKPAHNQDYQQLIDSLYRLAYELRANLDSIRRFIPDSVFIDAEQQAGLSDFGIAVSDRSSKNVALHLGTDGAANGSVTFWDALASLHDQYKPCAADTVFQPRIMIDGQAVADANYKYQNEHAARIKAETLSTLYEHKATVRIWMLIAAGLLILLLLFLVIRKL